MTNKEDEGNTSGDRSSAALLAGRVVSQVLDEACVIVNAVTESGQPCNYLGMLKNFKSYQLKDADKEDVTFSVFKMHDGDEINEKTDPIVNIVATSTPQKVAIDCTRSVQIETSFIGQGDEYADTCPDELNKSTSMFINHLFDMSDVERFINYDDTEKNQSDSKDLLTEAMAKIMESSLETALDEVLGKDIPTAEDASGVSPSTGNSVYSFLDDANTVKPGNDDAFCDDDRETYNNENCGTTSSVAIEEMKLVDIENIAIKKEDVTYYEHTYLTLNRDDDQCSDENVDPVLQDTKGMSLHEVELMTVPSSEEEASPRAEEDPLQPKSKELSAVSAVTASASGSRKSSLVQRCRTHGTRLLACLRGWWRRKTPGKRKETRVPGSVRGLCPLSPDARRRAASLLDQRRLGSFPSASQHVVWKFNTVSEALVNSSRWKNYTFDTTPDECGEY